MSNDLIASEFRKFKDHVKANMAQASKDEIGRLLIALNYLVCDLQCHHHESPSAKVRKK